MNNTISLKNLKNILLQIDDNILNDFIIASDIGNVELCEGNFELICLNKNSKKDKGISCFYDSQQYKDLILSIIMPLNAGLIKNKNTILWEQSNVETLIDGEVINGN
jgi:hypothetical protein